jgi:hypothetical protein
MSALTEEQKAARIAELQAMRKKAQKQPVSADADARNARIAEIRANTKGSK